jgi:large subunit ribosomal protein L16
MKQAPSSFRFRKNHKPKAFFLKAMDKKTFYPFYGIFALKSQGHGRLTFKQIEAGRRSIRRTLAKTGLVFIRVFPNASLTKRSVGMRMGKGKGSHAL